MNEPLNDHPLTKAELKEAIDELVAIIRNYIEKITHENNEVLKDKRDDKSNPNLAP